MNAALSGITTMPWISYRDQESVHGCPAPNRRTDWVGFSAQSKKNFSAGMVAVGSADTHRKINY